MVGPAQVVKADSVEQAAKVAGQVLQVLAALVVQVVGQVLQVQAAQAVIVELVVGQEQVAGPAQVAKVALVERAE